MFFFPIQIFSTKGDIGLEEFQKKQIGTGTIPKLHPIRWSCMQDFLLKGLPEKEVSFCTSVADFGCLNIHGCFFLDIWK